MAESENRQKPISQETHPPSRDYSFADEREKLAADWRGYSPETLHALDA
jgi:hypothetical protein